MIIYEDPCEHCGQPLTVRENGHVEDMTYTDDCAVRHCIHCCKPLSLEDIDEVRLKKRPTMTGASYYG